MDKQNMHIRSHKTQVSFVHEITSWETCSSREINITLVDKEELHSEQFDNRSSF